MGMIARLGAAKVAVEARWQVEGRSERERRQVLQQAVHAASERVSYLQSPLGCSVQ